MNKDDDLKRCQEEVRRLEAENHDLRDSSDSFGCLAERLNQELHSERRRAGIADRRQTLRDCPDRRLVHESSKD